MYKIAFEMKIAIIIFTILTLLNGLGFIYTRDRIRGSITELYKIATGKESVTLMFYNIFKFFMYIFACVLVTLLLIHFI